MVNYSRLDKYVEPLIAAVRVAERFLCPDDDWVEDDRRIVYEAAQRHLGHLHTFVREKGKADYITTADADADAVEEALHEAGYQRNLASTRKYRTHHGGGRQWAAGSWVYDPPEDEGGDGLNRQHHVYLFEGPDGTTDVYGHEEVSAREGTEHVTETDQTHGDPQHRARDALAVAAIPCDRRDL